MSLLRAYSLKFEYHGDDLKEQIEANFSLSSRLRLWLTFAVLSLSSTSLSFHTPPFVQMVSHQDQTGIDPI